MKVLCEIKNGFDDVKEVRNKETQEIRALKQQAFLDLGSAYPERCRITVSERLAPGSYEIQLPMRIGRWEDPEVNPFAPITVVKRVDPAKATAAASQ